MQRKVGQKLHNASEDFLGETPILSFIFPKFQVLESWIAVYINLRGRNTDDDGNVKMNSKILLPVSNCGPLFIYRCCMNFLLA